MNDPILSHLLHEAYKAGRASAVADMLEERPLTSLDVDDERIEYVAQVLSAPELWV
jgi:hypothetical protein